MGNPYRSPQRACITAEYVRARFIYADGDIYWKISPGRNRKIGDRAYSISHGTRKTVRVGTIRVPQSHVVWLYHKGYWPLAELDHKDRDSLNDRLSNLRDATTQKNCMNQTVRKNNKSGFKGVTKHPQQSGYWARISADGYRYQLGLYPTAELAAGAYRIAAAAMHAEFSGV